MAPTEAPLLLAVEDDPQMRRFLRVSLTANGFRVIEAGSAREAVTAAANHEFAVMLLDLGLPDEDGLTLLRRFRASSRIPVIVISARGREADRSAAIEAGADDYLTKPFGVTDLLLRLRAALEDAGPRDEEGERERERSPVAVGPLRIDLLRGVATLAGREIALTPVERGLLVALARKAGRVVTHRQLLEEISKLGHAEQTSDLRVHMARLRRKVEIDPARPRLLTTEPGVGYRLAERPSRSALGGGS